MNSKIKYTEEPLGKLKVVEDFLPPPDQLVLKEETIKVTISLKNSVDFFKKEAKKHRASYQKMIRQVINWYTVHIFKRVPSKPQQLFGYMTRSLRVVNRSWQSPHDSEH